MFKYRKIKYTINVGNLKIIKQVIQNIVNNRPSDASQFLKEKYPKRKRKNLNTKLR